MIKAILDKTFRGEVPSVTAEDPPTHHYAAQPVLVKVGNELGLASITLIHTSFIPDHGIRDAYLTLPEIAFSR